MQVIRDAVAKKGIIAEQFLVTSTSNHRSLPNDSAIPFQSFPKINHSFSTTKKQNNRVNRELHKLLENMSANSGELRKIVNYKI